MRDCAGATPAVALRCGLGDGTMSRLFFKRGKEAAPPAARTRILVGRRYERNDPSVVERVVEERERRRRHADALFDAQAHVRHG